MAEWRKQTAVAIRKIMKKIISRSNQRNQAGGEKRKRSIKAKAAGIPSADGGSVAKKIETGSGSNQ